MPYSQKQLKDILYIEDDAGLARLMQIRMERFGYNIDIASTAEEGSEKIKNKKYDLILLDNYLPGISGIELLKKLQLTDSDSPVIFLTSSGDEKLAIEALSLNAADYMIKDSGQSYLELLPSVMAAAHTRVELIKQNQYQKKRLTDYANELTASQQRLNLALEGTETGVWDWNIKTGELYWTENLKDWLELPPGEKPSTEYWFSRIHPDYVQHVKEAMRDHLAGRTKNYYCVFKEKARTGSDREWNWIIARGLAQRDKNGTAYRMTGTSSDFTIHKQLEEQLEQEKNKAESASRSKSEFLATMSHEIRTPMNAIIGLSDILSRSQLNERQREIIETMKTSSATLLTLINDLLDISRIEANQIEIESLPFELHQIISETASMLTPTATAKGLNFEVECSSLAGLQFMGDPHRIKQIITNLCGNALKFTDKGKIKISSRYKSRGNIYDVEISVSDSGIGIPEDKIKFIFDKFVQADQSITRRFGGTGLGLAISNSLAHGMGGHIEVESKDGMGSTFTLYLPLKLVAGHKEIIAENTNTAASEHDRTTGNKPKVLLVEDYAPNIMVASLMLENMGYQFEHAHNGAEAVEMVKAAPEKFGIILMDVQMPVMDGFAATRIIRELEKEKGTRKHIIIGLTAHALAGDREKCIEAGMNEYTTKPINAAELEAKISNLWKRSKAAA